MTVVELLRLRRAASDAVHLAETRHALADTAYELRRQAQPYFDRGRPDLAQPYVEEAELFEAASRRRRAL